MSPLLPKGWGYAPSWSPVGDRLAFIGQKDGERFIFAKTIPGLTEPEAIVPGIHAVSWSRSGDLLAYMVFREGTGLDIWTTSLGGGTEHPSRPQLNAPYFEGTPALSPDGQWLAYASNLSGRVQIYAVRLDRSQEPHQISTGWGYEPLWAPDGGTIYYIEDFQKGGVPHRRMMAVDVTTEPAFEASSPRLLFEGEFLKNDLQRFVRNHDLSPDGKHFLMIEREEEPLPARKVKFVLHWYQELREKVP